ncbi:MAG: hypothetical protein HYV16_14730 [Gammaproteobacteria bacterium]|nr:hypothetical protein [Gammaproteobacteria bacterium]
MPLRNAGAVVEGRAEPEFGAPVLLALGGRGIRSLERVGERYLIVAGAADDGDDFALFDWSGAASDVARRIPADGLSGLRPEALFADYARPVLHVLSDDGGVQVGDMPCKALPSPERKSFRALSLPAGG